MTRDFFQPARSPLCAMRAAVAASHPLAAAEGLRILQNGGNAVDAGLAAIAVSCAVEPQMVGVGGDCFALLQTPQGEIKALDGAGWTPAGLDAESFIRERNPAHLVTVPGAVAAWRKLHADFATMPLSRLFAKAVEYADGGYPVAPRVARDWRKCRAKLAADDGARAVFLPNGRTPAIGEVHRQPALAATLAAIAADGGEGFYRGKIAAALIRRLRALGGKHRAADFAEYEAEYVAPICAEYRGLDIYECPPSSQGAIALLLLGAMRRFDWGKMSEAARIARFATLVEAAYRRRDALLADPRAAAGEVFWDAAAAERIAALSQTRRVVPAAQATKRQSPNRRGRGDTVYLCAVDDRGFALSLICSLFEPFGAAIVEPRSGVLLQNRGLCFARRAGHPNACAPRKRPMHTIIPALGAAASGGGRAMPFGVMGGDYQAAGHAQFLMNVLDLGMDPQRALDAPRIFPRAGILEVEPTLSAAIRRALARRGFRVGVAADPIGGGQAIWRAASGALIAASDPRKDGAALGF